MWKSQMIFVFSFSKIPGFENILQLGEITNNLRSVNSFYDLFEASKEGKTRGGNKRAARIELRHFFLEMDPD